MLLKVNDYAAREGISKVAAYKRLKRCGITTADGLIDVDQVDRAWNSIKDEAQQRERAAPKAPPGKPDKPDIPPVSSFNDAKTKTAWVKLEEAALDLAERRDKLIPKEHVIAAALDRARTEKEALQNWPSRVAATLAAQLGIDDRKLQNLLDAEIRKFLEERSGGANSVLDDFDHESRFGRRKSA